MPSYAVLGATGSTGQSLLTILSQHPDKEIHAYCLSESKLLRLEKLRLDDPIARLPRLIVLSSASLDPHLYRDIPKLAHRLLTTAVSFVYDDLRAAEKFLREKEDWISMTFIKPGGSVHDAQKGHRLSMERQQTPPGWLELAAGMVEVADAEGGVFDMKNVSVLSTATDMKFQWQAPLLLAQGLLVHFFPFMYLYLGQWESCMRCVVALALDPIVFAYILQYKILALALFLLDLASLG